MIALILAASLVAQEVPAAPVEGQIVRSYDKFKDHTIFEMMVGKVQDPEPDFFPFVMLILTSPVCKGDLWEPSKPNDEVGLNFYSASKGWRFLDNRQTIFLIDGKRVDMGNPAHTGKVSGGSVSEEFLVRSNVATVEMMSKAQKVEVQVNGVEMVLKPHQLTMMRDFVARLKMTDAEASKAQEEREAKKTAIRDALAKLETSSKATANRASKSKKQQVYDREFAKGMDKLTKDFGFDKYPDPQKELRRFLDSK